MKRAVEWPLKSFEVSFVYCLNFGFCWKTQQATEGEKKDGGVSASARSRPVLVIRGSRSATLSTSVWFVKQW